MTESLVKILIDKSPVACYLLDSKWKLRQINSRALLTFTGVENLYTSDFREVLRAMWPPEIAEKVVARFQHTMDTGEPYFDTDFSGDRADIKERQYYEWQLHRVNLEGENSAGVLCYFSEITKHVRRQSLKEAEQLFHQLFDLMPELCAVIQPDGFVEYYNEAWYQYTGATKKQIEGWGWESLHDPEQLPKVKERWMNSLRTGTPFEMSFPLRGVDGSYKTFLNRISPIRDVNGKILRWVGICTDIQKELEQATAVAEDEKRALQLFQQLFDLMPQLAWTARPDGYIDFYNKGWYEYTGTSYEQMAGWGWEAVHDPEVLPEVKKRWQESIAAATPFEMTFPLKGKDGRFRSFLTRINPIKDADGNLIRWIGINTDIQNELESSSAIAESEKRWRVLANLMPSFVWVADDDGYTFFQNDSFLNYTGYSRDELKGNGWKSIVHPEDLSETVRKWQLAVKETAGYSHELRLRRHDGVYHWFLSAAVPVFDTEGKLTNWYGNCTDIHEQKCREEEDRLAAAELERQVLERTREMRTAKEIAENALQAKTRLLSSVSHEVRTPMGGIMGLAEILSLKDLGEENNAIIQTILQTSNRLLQMLNDLLEAARLQHADLKLEHSSFAVRPILGDVRQLIKPDAEKKGLQLTGYCDSDVPRFVTGDEMRVRQVLLNLCYNAVKYTDEGSIDVTATLKDKTDSLAIIRFAVRDTGIGIAADQQHKIFQPFQQLAGKANQSKGGVGLGLSICKDLVELMGGSIGVASDTGKGSDFWFEIPFSTENGKP